MCDVGWLYLKKKSFERFVRGFTEAFYKNVHKKYLVIQTRKVNTLLQVEELN
jgi:hypothetical protein